MRGARRLGALFLCVASLVAALVGDDLINRGFTATSVGPDGTQFFEIKLGMASEFTSGSEFTVDDMLENIAFARQWLSAVTSLGPAVASDVVTLTN